MAYRVRTHTRIENGFRNGLIWMTDRQAVQRLGGVASHYVGSTRGIVRHRLQGFCATREHRKMRTLFMPVTLLILALSGCGITTATSPSGSPEGGDVPTTAQALAFVAAEHAGTPSSATGEKDAAEEFHSKAVGTELRYGSDGEYDGDMLVVAVGQGLDKTVSDCEAEANEYLAGCVETDQGMLMWEDVTPESDPGVVYVVVDKGETIALLFYAGPTITGDPRELDMPISTDVLFAIANDPRVDEATSQEAVDAGADLPFWQDPRR
jgi:hypothetical protein